MPTPVGASNICPPPLANSIEVLKEVGDAVVLYLYWYYKSGYDSGSLVPIPIPVLVPVPVIPNRKVQVSRGLGFNDIPNSLQYFEQGGGMVPVPLKVKIRSIISARFRSTE